MMGGGQPQGPPPSKDQLYLNGERVSGQEVRTQNGTQSRPKIGPHKICFCHCICCARGALEEIKRAL